MAAEKKSSVLKGDELSRNTDDDKYQKKEYKTWDNKEVLQYFLNQPGFSELSEKNRDAIKSAFEEHGITGKDFDTLSKSELQKMKHLRGKDLAQAFILGIIQILHGPDPEATAVSHDHSLPQEYKVFNDPIHGHIILHPLLVKIIDTPQFQRLRYIKKLGCVYLVFPGASHNRFEHSLGVSHLAGEMADTLRREQPELGITPVDVLCVKIAGLCYDLGRGPFSGVFDEWCKLKQLGWNFESASVVMFDFLLAENQRVREVFQEYGVGEEEQKFVNYLISGDEHFIGTEPANDQCPKMFLGKIVVNRRTAIDVETMESIARDSYHLRMSCNYDWSRLVKFVRVDCGQDERQLCFRDKEAHSLHEMLLSRLSLRRKASCHKTVRLIERNVIEALTKADSVLKLSTIVQDLQSDRKEKRFKAAEEYTRLTDHVWHRILTSTDDRNLEDARIILQKIEGRELYKYVGVALDHSDEGQTTGRDFLESLRIPLSSIARENVYTDEVVFQYGTKSVQNPVNDVRFYSKSDPNRTFEIKSDQISQLLPVKFTEKALRVYCKNPDMAARSAMEQQFRRIVSHEGWYWESYTPYASPHKPSQDSPAAAERQESPNSVSRNLFPDS